MTLNEILQQLDDPEASYQWEAVDAAVEHRDEITPLLLQRLEAASRDPQPWLESDSPGLLYTLALLAHFRERAAHAALVRLARQPEEIIEPLLDDAITETLPLALWLTSGGDLDGVRALADDRAAPPWCRAIAADVVAWGALFGTLDRDDTLAWLAQRLTDPTYAEPGHPALDGVLHALLDLHPQPHEALLRDWLRSSEDAEWGSASEAILDRVLAQDRQAFLEEMREEVAARIPDDIHGYLSHWYGFQPGGAGPEEGELEEFLQWLDGELDATMDEELPLPEFAPGYDDDLALPPLPDPAPGPRATRPKPPPAGTRKKKRKQQKKARKAGRKGR